MNYEKDIRIDQDALDVEWLQQASLTLRYNKHAAYTRTVMDNAKENMELVAASFKNKIRKNPAEFKLEKVTEGALQEALLQTDEYKEASETYSEAKYEYEVAQGACRALQDKKSALENLVKLHGQNYFAGPQVPRDISKEWEEKQKDKSVQKKVQMKRNRT